MNDYIDRLVEAGRTAALYLWMPRHRGAIRIDDNKFVMWSWETKVPHLTDLEIALRREANSEEGIIYEILGGGIFEGLGLWIISADTEEQDPLEELIWQVFQLKMMNEMGGGQ